ncbi:MAG: glycosyltransferase [Spirochaetales bacterium]|nr:glycosyltransferase [Spirochaetales bacterium]
MQLRICYLLHTFPKLSETFILNEILSISKYVDFYILADKKETNNRDIPDARQIDRERIMYLPQNLSTWRKICRIAATISKIPFPGLINLCLGAFLYPAGISIQALIFYKELKIIEGKIDIFHCEFATYGRHLAFLHYLHLLKKPFVTAFRGNDISGYVTKHGWKAYKILFKESAAFLPICYYFARLLIKNECQANKIITHRSPINISQFKKRKNKPPEYPPVKLICIGRLYPKKGLHLAIQCTAELFSDGLKPTLEIIGRGPEKERLKGLAAFLGIESIVTFTDSLENSKIPGKLAEADFFLSLNCTGKNGDKEGIPNTIKEAMAVGVPVIAARHSGIPELVIHGQTGFLVPENDYQKAAEIIKTIIHTPDESTAYIIENARRHIETHYDMNILSHELYHIYKNLLTDMLF